MRKIWCRIQTINKNQGQNAGRMLSSPLNLTTRIFFFLAVTEKCTQLFL